MRATRRTFRTAAITTGAIAALAAPAAAAFADTPPAPQQSATTGDQDQTTPNGNGSDDQGNQGTDQGDQGTDQGQGDQGKGDQTDPPKPGDWESKGTVDLGDGWSAKVDVNASARSARAQISQDGAAKGSLEAYDGSKSTKIGDYTFTLTSDGTITAKKDTQPPKPGDWVSKGTVNLGDGWTAKVDVNASARSARAQ
ncbi:hypothetical protein G3I40_29140, partial [Streptomyces sp. SID14478]|nr:hypothetical protein [Streptomyces sp. SID14478]